MHAASLYDEQDQECLKTSFVGQYGLSVISQKKGTLIYERLEVWCSFCRERFLRYETGADIGLHRRRPHRKPAR